MPVVLRWMIPITAILVGLWGWGAQAQRQNEVDYRPTYTPWGSKPITPNDGTVLVPICRALYVGGAGNVTLRLLDGSTPLFTAPPVGTQLQVQFDQVKSTGTTATFLVCLY